MYDFSLLAFFLLRLVSGLLMAQHGAQKMFGWFGGMPNLPSPPPAFTQVWFGGILELVGGLLLVLGLYTRCAAFILSGMMAVAYWQFHAPNGTWPIENGGEPAVLYCFIFLVLCSRRDSIISIDNILRARKAKPGS